VFAYRIADSRHPIFDPTGATLHGGRWNSVGHRIIYAAETYAGALLEVLVHANLSQPPKNHKVIRIEIPDEVAIENVTADTVPGWDMEDMIASRAFGDHWIRENRTAVLKVPSVITRGRESNLVLNALHSQFSSVSAGKPEAVYWDARLFPSGLSPRRRG
jgi:RES domain-containing protein